MFSSEIYIKIGYVYKYIIIF